MDLKKIAEKYINYGITWLNGEFDDYKGLTTTITVDEELSSNQLLSLCEEILKDERVKIAVAEQEERNTITIVFDV